VEVIWEDEKTLRIRSLVPQRAVTPGQSCVLYEGERCLGGGIVTKVLDAGQAGRNGNEANL
jgi:tRNA-specific 2-thiouridylase